MIYVDKRCLEPHSTAREIVNYLPPNTWKPAFQSFADLFFLGEGGPGGLPVSIGVEIKTPEDILGCIVTGRWSGHQLIGLINSYDLVYLIIYGRYRADNRSGLLQIQNRMGNWVDASTRTTDASSDDNGNGYLKRWMYRDLDGWLTTMETKHRVKIWRAYDIRETAQIVWDRYQWWNSKTWESHKADMAFNTVGQPTLVKPSVVRRVASQLPSIGWERAGAAELRFKTVREMVNAGEEDWMGIEGIGHKIAHDVVKAVSGEEPEHECKRHRKKPREV